MKFTIKIRCNVKRYDVESTQFKDSMSDVITYVDRHDSLGLPKDCEGYCGYWFSPDHSQSADEKKHEDKSGELIWLFTFGRIYGDGVWCWGIKER